MLDFLKPRPAAITTAAIAEPLDRAYAALAEAEAAVVAAKERRDALLASSGTADGGISSPPLAAAIPTYRREPEERYLYEGQDFTPTDRTLAAVRASQTRVRAEYEKAVADETAANADYDHIRRPGVPSTPYARQVILDRRADAKKRFAKFGQMLHSLHGEQRTAEDKESTWPTPSVPAVK